MLLRPLPFLTIAALAAGCQSYRPAPLDLDRHHLVWASRDPASPTVAAYAEKLKQPHAPAAAFDPTDGVSLREAEILALFFNPRLRVARLNAAVSKAGAAEAGRWEDPRLNVDGERILQSVADPWVIGAAISITLPLSGRLALERRHAQAAADVELLRAYAEEGTLLADLREKWAEWAADIERIRLEANYLAELNDLHATAEKLQQAGEIDATGARLIRIERVTRQADLRALKRLVREREVRIKSLLGLVPDAPIRLISAMPAPPASNSAGERYARAERLHPALLIARAKYEAAERALELEVRRQYPDLTIGAGAGEDEGESRALFGAALPLPLFNRNIRAIAEARAARDASRAAAEAAFEELIAQIHLAQIAAASATDRRQTLEREVVPLVDEQLADLRRLGEAGEFDAFVLLEALRSAQEARLELLSATIKSSLATIELYALTDPGLPAPVGEEAK